MHVDCSQSAVHSFRSYSRHSHIPVCFLCFVLFVSVGKQYQKCAAAHTCGLEGPLLSSAISAVVFHNFLHGRSQFFNTRLLSFLYVHADTLSNKRISTLAWNELSCHSSEVYAMSRRAAVLQSRESSYQKHHLIRSLYVPCQL